MNVLPTVDVTSTPTGGGQMGFLSSALGGIAGSLVQGVFNAKQADKNRDFQAAMSNTSYQRAAKDLQAAGLNRILALGNGASTPTGAMATIENPVHGAAKISEQQIKKLTSEAQVEQLTSSARQADATADYNSQLTRQSQQQQKLISEQTKIARQDAEFYEKYGVPASAAAGTAGAAISGAKAAGSLLKQIKGAFK